MVSYVNAYSYDDEMKNYHMLELIKACVNYHQDEKADDREALEFAALLEWSNTASLPLRSF